MVERTGAPAWKMKGVQQQNRLLRSITQKDRLYRLPLEVLATDADGRTMLENIRIRGRVNNITLPAAAV